MENNKLYSDKFMKYREFMDIANFVDSLSEQGLEHIKHVVSAEKRMRKYRVVKGGESEDDR